jgi:peptidyl-prolyl cis-trans isomerase SurA
MGKRFLGSCLIAVTVFFFAPQVLYAAIVLDRVVAVVNNEVITWSELYKNMESEASEKVRALSDEERNKVFKSYEAAFLDSLIDMRLQIQEAGRLGMQVREEELKEAIENIKKKYQMTDAMLEDSLRKEGLTFKDYKKKLSDQILLGQFVNQQIRSKIVVTDQQVRNVLETLKEDTAGEEFKLRQIFLRKPKDEPKRREIEERAAMISQRLKSGEDFAAMAWEYSEDASAKIGGDLGYLKKRDMAAEFLNVLSGMKAGDVSGPFWTDQGIHMVKLEERIAPKSSEERKVAVRDRLEEEAFAEKYRSYIKSLRERSRIEIRL